MAARRSSRSSTIQPGGDRIHCTHWGITRQTGIPMAAPGKYQVKVTVDGATADKVYMNLIWLSGGVGMGASDEAGSIDYRPTDTQFAVLKVIEQDMAKAKAGFESLLSSVIPAFNKQMAGKAVVNP